MKFAKSMLFGISALGLAIGSAFAHDAALDMSRSQAAAEQIAIAEPDAVVLYGVQPDAVVLYEVQPDAVVLYEVEPALPPQSSLDESWSGSQVAGASSDPATGFD